MSAIDVWGAGAPKTALGRFGEGALFLLIAFLVLAPLGAILGPMNPKDVDDVLKRLK